MARNLLRLKTMGADKAVAIAGFAAADIDLVDHGIAIERVMAAQGLMHLIFGVAQVDTINVERDCAFDHPQFGHIDLFVQRRPWAGEIGVV